MSGGFRRGISLATCGVVVAVVSLATWAGLVHRYLTPADAPWLLLTRDVADHPVRAALLLVACLAAYTVLVVGAARLADRWRHGAPDAGPREGRVHDRVAWAYARWWRLALVLAVLWLPWLATSFPGQPSPDPSNMITEWVSTRADFAQAPPLAGPDQTAPYVDYPTSTYLLTDSDSLWSNHHPFYLVVAYGSLASASIALFDSLVPALLLASALSALFTLVAFGRALHVLGSLVPSPRVRLGALVVLGLSPLVPLWSLAEHKNQLFCAAFVWWLALLARLVHTDGPPTRRWYVETGLVSLLMAATVQFGSYVLLAQAVALLLLRGRRLAGLLAVALPAVVVTGSLAALTSAGLLIPSDPVETKGAQMQVLALVLTEHPDALTAQETADLGRIFDLEAFVASFDPSSSDPLKSTGPLSRKTASFRYETVQPEDWDTFNGIVLDVARRHPATALDGLFLKSYRYLDPTDRGTDWYPPWNPAYERSIEGHQVAPLEVNATLRAAVRDGANGCYEVSACRPLVSHGPRTVAIVLLLAGAIACRRRLAWFWALPFALQLAIAGVSPLSAGGRYVLACTYGLAIVLMLLAIDDRRGSPHERTPSGSRGSSTPSRPPSPAPSPQA
ncbi:DUF6020 family protein [Nocardioides litoris]|uniref:DUF6020 family protein n=1 Tax=Nocardioides litoris TaxID=1926648 RepID=UPI00111F0258|nr:DUF6020 family protein [Nocardioides litoris]